MKTILALTVISSALSAQSLSLKPNQWQTFLFNDPHHLSLHTDAGALSFQWPSSGTWIDYLLTKSPAPLAGTVAASIEVIASPDAIFDWHSEGFNTCTGTPATVRAYFESSSGGRWWSDPVSYAIANGTVTLSTALVPGMWSNVNGQMGDSSPATIDDFYRSLNAATRIGFSFGGGCFFGHGVTMTSGTAQFRLTGYTIQ